MRLADVLPDTLSQCTHQLVATARDRLDPTWIEEALQSTGAVSVRRRKLPADVVVWLVIGACLFAGQAFDQVIRHLGLTPRTSRHNLQAPPSSGAVAEARKRLGDRAMKSVFEVTARHWSSAQPVEQVGFCGLRVLCVDGFSVRTPDTGSNFAEFGKPASRRGEAAYPVVSVVALMEAVTHLVIDVELGGANASELVLFDGLVDRIPGASVTLVDRNYDSVWHLWRLGDPSRERHWLARSKGRKQARVIEEFGPGDQLVEIQTPREARRKHPELPDRITVRRIHYTAEKTEVTVLTTLTDPKRYPAADVARLYHQRWEIEMAIDDMKTEQRDSAVTLRSKAPVGIRQELYGLLVAHNLVRVEMAHSAALLGVPPTRISFHRALLVVCDHLCATVEVSPPTKWADHMVLLRSRLQHLLLPERRSDRHYPRAMKMPVGRYARKLPTPR